MKIKLEKTKLADEYGRPISFYHTTNVGKNINRFYPLSHFGTKKAAHMRGLHFAYKALDIPEPQKLPTELPKSFSQKLSKIHPNYLTTYQVCLYMKCPLEITDFGRHDLGTYHQRFKSFYQPKSIYLTPQECRERDDFGPQKMPYKKALTEFIFIDPINQSEENLKKELSAETLFPVESNNQSELAKQVAYQRMIRYLESEGYDGFVYKNDCEDVGQKSYIIFRPEQVFHKGETEHEIISISTENQQFLHKIEDKFFKSKGMIAPYQRKELNRQIRAKRLIKTK